MNEAELVANQTLTEKYLRKFNVFLERHSSSLVGLLESSKVPNTKGSRGSASDDAHHHASKRERKRTQSESLVSSYTLAHNIWNLTSDPIRMTWGPLVEPSSYEDLVSSVPVPPDGNPDVQKVLLVLVSVSSQMRELSTRGWSVFVYQFLLYGEGQETCTDTGVVEGEGHVSISKFLPTLYSLSDFVSGASGLVSHSFQQLESLFKDSKPHVVPIAGLHFQTLFRDLGALLSLLVVLDEVIGGQTTLNEHWTKYKRMITSVRADYINFDVDSENLYQLDRELEALDQAVFHGRIFRNLLDVVKGGRNRTRNTVLVEKFTTHLSLMEGKVEREFLDGVDELKPIAFAALFVFAASVLGQAFDIKRTFKRVWEVLKKVPAVPIGGSLWAPETFLNSFHLGTNNFFDTKVLATQSNLRLKFLENRVSSVPKDLMTSTLAVSSWAVRLQEVMYGKDSSTLSRDDLSQRCNLLLDGAKLAQSLSHNFRLVLNLHVTLGKPITKTLVVFLVQHLELVKAVQAAFHRYNVQICHSVIFILQTLLHIALCTAKSVKDGLIKSGAKDELRRDALSVLAVLENALKGHPSEKRLLVARLAFDWSIARCYWEDDDKRRTLEAALDRIQQIVELQGRIEELCNGNSLYYHRTILSAYYSTLYQSGDLERTKLPIVSLLLSDCLQLLEKRSPHEAGTVTKGFVQEVEGYLKAGLVERLCTDVETDLRLQTHSHLQMEQAQSGEGSPFRLGVKDKKSVLETPALEFSGKKLSLKYTTEYYLSKNFYNLASVALHDWQSYATMRVLAMEKYQLNVIHDHLPGHSLEQGLDILQIVRDLKKFVTEFSYNLNNQVFVQVSSPNKHLETVSIRHLANSMRTHGPGMANNIVDYAYQFLRMKIRSFSELLFYEQIKSRLAKDIRVFKQGRQSQEAGGSTYCFQFEKARKFQVGIRKLGVSAEGLSILDKFRVLITHIGNALGFVRLVRSGGLHFLAAGCRFLPDFEDLPDLREMIQSARQLDPQLQTSVSNLNSSIAMLTSSFSGGVDYFRLLVGAFQAAVNQPANAHMRNFYVIIPALTLSYVDHIRSCKERLAKKSKSSTLFTDDGFPMGLAYLLKVLGQDADFESLQWFTGVSQKLLEEKRVAHQTIEKSKDDEKLQQANTLTAKRVHDVLQEFHLLSYNLSSARIFFQSSNPDPVSTVPSNA